MSARGCLAGLLVLLALLAFAGPLAAREVCVPFKAVGITTSVEGPFPVPGRPDQFALELAGKGRGTHLGNMTSMATVVFTLAEVAPGVWVPVAFEGNLTFVAANGDELYVTTAGVPTGPDSGVGAYAITGGTGRFEGASGSGSFEKAADIGTFDGNIRLVRGK